MAKNYKPEEEWQKAHLRAQGTLFTGGRFGRPASDFTSVITPSLRGTWSGVGQGILTLENHPSASWAIYLVVFFQCSGSHFLPGGRRTSSRPCVGKVPIKIRTCNLAASGPGVFVFHTEGDGWDQFAFPFLTLYFWVHVYLNTYTNVHVYLLNPPADQSARTTFFLTGLSVYLCDEAEPVGLGLSHVVILGRSVTCF